MRLQERNTEGEASAGPQKFISTGGRLAGLAAGFASGPYLFGKIKSSSRSARAFSSDAITESKSVTEIIP
jgi:hypothetical protein